MFIYIFHHTRVRNTYSGNWQYEWMARSSLEHINVQNISPNAYMIIKIIAMFIVFLLSVNLTFFVMVRFECSKIGSNQILVIAVFPVRIHLWWVRAKTGWLGIRKMCASGATFLPANFCFSEWGLPISLVCLTPLWNVAMCVVYFDIILKIYLSS